MKKRRLLFAGFDQLYAEVDALQSHGYRSLGQWSLTQICDHLRIFMHCSMHGFGDEAVPFSLRLARVPVRYITLWSNWIPAGFKAPDRFLPKVPHPDDPVVLDSFRSIAGEVENFIGEFHFSPVFGRMTAPQWRRIHLIHAAHHLGFLIPNET